MSEFRLDDSLLRAKSIGDKVEGFYLSLASISAERDGPDLYQVAECLQHVEEHQPISPLGENSQVVDEIVVDCRKKAVQCIRNAYTQQVQNMIVSCRKRLITKINRNASDEDAKNHGSRHFNLLKELLGRWSNIMNEISSLGLSMETIHAVLKPLHSRIIDCSVDCMQQFQKDKNLENWHQRVLNASRYEDRSDGDGSLKTELPFSILTLDNLVAQVAAMREIVGTYYAFLDNQFSSEVTLYDASELNQWRELDVMYMSLEAGYLTHAVADATSETALVEVQTGVLVPQCIEDTFFIVTRVAERCMSTLAHQALMTVANKILEIVDVDTASGALEMEPDNENLRLRPPWLLQEQRCFRGCCSRGSIDIEVLRGGAQDAVQERNHAHAAVTATATIEGGVESIAHGGGENSRQQPGGGMAPSNGSGSREKLAESKFGKIVGSELAEELQAGADVISDVSTAVVGIAQGWWAGRTADRTGGSGANKHAATATTEAPSASGAGREGAGVVKGPHVSTSSEDLAGALIAALEADADHTCAQGATQSQSALPSQVSNGALDSALLGGLSLLGVSAAGAEADLILGCHNSYLSQQSQKGNPNPYGLSTPDWAVLLNALNATRLGIANIRLLFSETCSLPEGQDQGQGQSQLVSTAQLIITELSRAEAVYSSWFSRHAEDLFLEPFLQYVATPLAEEIFGDHDFYAIDADEMDRRSSAVGGGQAMLLVRIVEAFVHKPTSAADGAVVEGSAARGAGRGASTGPPMGNVTSPPRESKRDLNGGSTNGVGVEEEDAEKEERAHAREAEAEAQRVATYSVLDRCVRPFCSGVTFSAILHQLAEFTCEQLLLEIIGEEEEEGEEEGQEDVTVGESQGRGTGRGRTSSRGSGKGCTGTRRVGGAHFSEWGALLFNNEVLAVIEVFELADERCQAALSSAGDAGASGKTGSSFSTTRHVRNLFNPLLWALKLLTLDKPSDVTRYRLPADTFAMLDGSRDEAPFAQQGERGEPQHSSDTSLAHGEGSTPRARRKSSVSKWNEDPKSNAEVTTEVARQILARRVDFSETSVATIKINIV